jgi:integrase
VVARGNGDRSGAGQRRVQRVHGRRLPEFIQEVKLGSHDLDLEAFVERWVREMERRKQPSERIRQRYENQVRTFIKPGFRLSRLTRPAIRQWLEDLPVAQPNRYRSALSSFCKFLVLEEVLEYNPVTAVPASQESDPRDRHLSPDEALWVVRSMPTAAHAALQALIICTAADVESALAIRVKDIDRRNRTVFLRGTKKRWRERTCYVYDRWSTMWNIVEDFLSKRLGLPDALVFEGFHYDLVWEVFREKLRELKVDDYTMKDHRHTWAVQALRDRIQLHAVSQQMGHRDPTMVLKVYGKHVSRAADYRVEIPTADHSGSFANSATVTATGEGATEWRRGDSNSRLA